MSMLYWIWNQLSLLGENWDFSYDLSIRHFTKIIHLSLLSDGHTGLTLTSGQRRSHGLGDRRGESCDHLERDGKGLSLSASIKESILWAIVEHIA